MISYLVSTEKDIAESMKGDEILILFGDSPLILSKAKVAFRLNSLEGMMPMMRRLKFEPDANVLVYDIVRGQALAGNKAKKGAFLKFLSLTLRKAKSNITFASEIHCPICERHLK